MIDREELKKVLKTAYEEYCNNAYNVLRETATVIDNNALNCDIDSLVENANTKMGEFEEFAADKVIDFIKGNYKEEHPLETDNAIYFAGLMEDFINIPSCVCELIERKLTQGKHEEVVRYIIARKKELYNKKGE